jgi:ATP-dependent helicase/nuclease subunit A
LAGFILFPALTRPEAEVLRQESVPLSASDGFPWDIRKITVTEVPAAGQKKENAKPPGVKARGSDVAALTGALDYKYPYMDASQIPSKLTATGLKGRFADYEAAEEAETPAYAKKQKAPALRPNFITMKTTLTPAERGTALHLAMQYIDYNKCATADEIKEELCRLKVKNFLSAKQAEAVDPEKIRTFFASELGYRVKHADKLYREFKFSLLVRAEDYYTAVGNDGSAAEDEILLQGVVDCCFLEIGALHVIDFKTDYVTAETLEEKKLLYAPQLEAYGRAMERITGMPVKSKIIYFFAIDTATEII